MALRQEQSQSRPYEQKVWQGHKDLTSYSNKQSRKMIDPLRRYTSGIVMARPTLNYDIPTAFQRNIHTSNNEVAELIEQSRPTHIQAMVYPERKLFHRDEDDFYSSIRI